MELSLKYFLSADSHSSCCSISTCPVNRNNASGLGTPPKYCLSAVNGAILMQLAPKRTHYYPVLISPTNVVFYRLCPHFLTEACTF